MARKTVYNRVFSEDLVRQGLEDKAVLFLDDESDFFNSISPYFEDYGMECFYADNPVDFFNIVEEKTAEYDDYLNTLLVVDLHLVEDEDIRSWESLGGYKFLKEFRARQRRNPVVIASAYLVDNIPRRAKEAFESLDVLISLQKTSYKPQLADAIIAAFLLYIAREKTRLNEFIRHRASLRDDITKSVFHAIQDPLGRLSNKIDFMKKEYPDDEKEFQLIQNDISQVLEMKKADRKLREQLDDFGDVPIIPLDLKPWLKRWIQNAQKDERYPGIDLEIDSMPKSSVRIKGAHKILDLLMDNLVGNAQKAMKNKISKRVKLSLKVKHGSRAIICVQDEGDGFPNEVFQKLLRKPVSMWQHSSSSDDMDHGYGLILTHRLVTRVLKGQLIPSNIKEKGRCIGAKVCLQAPVIRDKDK